MARYRIGIDVGGTFTDGFFFDEETKEIFITKVPSVPANPDEGIINNIKESSVSMSDVSLFTHGTTVATNALITRTHPKTGAVFTKGFRDVNEIRRAEKPDLWDPYKDVAPPYIPRRDRLEVEERIDYAGNVLTPLNEAEARRVAEIFRKRGMKGIAVCFINSYMNPEHELKMKKILEEELPGVFVCTSSETVPEIFEHERFSTTIINACLGPVMGDYIERLAKRLQDLGYRGDVLILHSGGGVMTASTIRYYAARVGLSGPCAGACAMSYIARLAGYRSALGLDMGGTSADISFMYEGELKTTNEWYVEFGYPILFPAIEIITIGAGGGSIAWIDEGGSLRNGPQSAGADPGPACYLKGGTNPTNTDANLLLGRLGKSLIGGGMQLDVDAAYKAVKEKIADPLGMDPITAALAIIKVANANMCDALRLVSIRRGYDPREIALVAFGGAGPLHGAFLAQEMDIPVVIIPRYPGITSAMGCLLVNIRHDLSKNYLADLSKVDLNALETEFQLMEKEASERLDRDGVPKEKRKFTRYLDMRYVGQWRSLSITCPSPIMNLDEIVSLFHQEHNRAYAYMHRRRGIEIYGLRLVAEGEVLKPELPKARTKGKVEDAIKEIRPVYFEATKGFTDTKVYDREKLPVGAKLQGPAIVEQFDSTTVIPPGLTATVDEYLNIIINVRGE
ncbi:hydantoinase/oxoprolinase family protein [Desulfofundulus thermosubterraneus]|uniref:N-methylhydantoinase A n=1 Tax=Desulfofundulus thermosubterraneus DSM 16057 TaxID=1121432 RepID=A0A1M6MRJ7_9FIRM|nr:hydantoinase/oxoprolinase family protein [Desulfofundulus thermosubterraneus]SHJ86087.1 N-methylhydantoinase A [Desulfofundulus thermosubterraneus DSM 16057]